MMIEMLEVFALQRAKTAREAVKVMGELAEKYGYGDGGETLVVVDGSEVWVFDIVGAGPLWTPDSGKPGAVWAAARVPDDHVYASANRSRIGKLNLDDPDNYMASSNVVSFAEEMGLYDKAKDGDFLFWKAYNPDPYGGPYYQRRREWRALSLMAPSLNLDPYLDPVNEQYPFSVKPDKKIAVQDLMAINRDRYEGTIFDLTKGLAAGPFACPNRYSTPGDVRPENAKDTDWERAISMFRCSYSFVGQARASLPPAIGGVLWFGEDAPHSTCYVPIYSGVTEMPKPYSSGSRSYYDKESAWWAFNFVSNFADLKFSYMIQDIEAVQEELEGQFFAMQPGIEAAALKLYDEDPEKAKAFLTNYTKNMAMLALARWRTLADELIYKYNDGYVDGKSVGYPTEWLEAVEFGKTNVVP
jgi:dipeptidase